MERDVYVVPHTHWDREWYQPHELFRWRLVRMIDELIDHLEGQPEFGCFNLDGQSIVIADYLELRPEQEPRLRALIEAGRVVIGPWWVQPDEFLPTGESLIRNLQRGIRYAEGMGGCLRVGHCADQFGHIAQLPQILRQFGLTSACLWRGVPGSIPGWSFWWEAPDGTRLPVLYLRNSYSSGWRLPRDPRRFLERVRRQERDLRPGLPALLMNGTDHSRMERHVPDVLAAAAGQGYRFHLATLAEYERAVLTAGVDEVVHAGELRSPDRSNILVGVLSTRMPIKQRDFAVARALERYAEPLELLAWLNGSRGSTPAIRHAWGVALENTPHDSICGCSIDQVHREMFPRYDRAEQLAMQVARESAAAVIARAAVPGCGGLFVFRPVAGAPAAIEADVPAAWREFDALELPEGVRIPFTLEPAGGGTVLQHEQVTPAGALRHLDFLREQRYDVHAVEAMTWRLDGQHLRIETTVGPDITVIDEEAFRQEVEQVVAEDRAATAEVVVRESTQARLSAVLPAGADAGATIAVPMRGPGPATHSAPSARRLRSDRFDVRMGRRWLRIEDRETGIVLDPGVVLVSEGDRGDEYNADILDDGIDEPAEIRLHGTVSTPAWQELRWTCVYDLPARLARSRRRRVGKERVLQPVELRARLWHGLPLVELRLEVTNVAADHRLRALFPLPFAARTVVTENQFHVAARPVEPPPWNGESAELPPTTYPQKAFAAVEHDGLGIAVFNRGLPEGEVVTWRGRQSIAVTLLRCVGWLSRNDLRSRRGGAGPMVATRDSQLPGRHTFELALCTYRGEWHDAGIQALAHAWVFPPIGWATNGHRGASEPPTMDVLALDGDVKVSAMHRGEAGDPLVRVVAGPKGGRATLAASWIRGRRAERVDLLERNGVDLPVDGDRCMLDLRPWEIATVRFSQGRGT